MAAPEAPRPWSDLEGSTTFEVRTEDGFVYKLIEPAILQLVAKGFVPAALIPGIDAGSDRSKIVGQSKFLIDEKMQNEMILSHVIEPVLWAGAVADCPEGSVPLVRIGRHRDLIVAKILDRLFSDVTIRGAAFRGKERDGRKAVAGGKGKRQDDHGAAA